MIEKKIETGYLLDFYSGLLSERQQSVIDMYYNEDMSLSEIAGEIGISRQGVRDIIVKSSAMLEELEEKLGVAGKFRRINELASAAAKKAEEEKNASLSEFISSVLEIID